MLDGISNCEWVLAATYGQANGLSWKTTEQEESDRLDYFKHAACDYCHHKQPHRGAVLL